MTVHQIDRLVVTEGTVQCRVRHAAVDIDECFHCPHVRAVNEDGSPPLVICDSSERADPEDSGQVLLRWWLQRTRQARRT